MPLRYTPINAALNRGLDRLVYPRPNNASTSHLKLFHTSRILQDDASSPSSQTKNHYETLNVHPDASPAEIKKYANYPPSTPSPQHQTNLPLNQILLRPLKKTPPRHEPLRPPRLPPLHPHLRSLLHPLPLRKAPQLRLPPPPSPPASPQTLPLPLLTKLPLRPRRRTPSIRPILPPPRHLPRSTPLLLPLRRLGRPLPQAARRTRRQHRRNRHAL